MKAEIEKAFVSVRVGITQWMPEHRFQRFLALLRTYRGIADEITFFTSDTHPPLPLAEMSRRVVVLTERMSSCREAGFRTGINILATIGHHEEDLPHSLGADYTRMTDIGGKTCLGSFCPNDEGLQDYVERVYEILAQADPDYIWIDDDVRLFGHMPILCGCFCDRCLQVFAEECGTEYTRASLKAAFDQGAFEEKRKIRKAWLEHNRQLLAQLLERIEGTVHRLKPGMPLGFMTGDRFYEGYDFNRWAEILAGPAKAPVMWRPGGGFYADDTMKELVAKSHAVGRQVSLLPDAVISIQSEIENFPYQCLKKAAHTTALEAASHIAAGCTGAAFNVLSPYDEPLDEYEPLLAQLSETRPFLDLMAQSFGRSEPLGVYTGWNKDTGVTGNLVAGSWLEVADAGAHPSDDVVAETFEIGIPACYSQEQASVTVLAGDVVLAMSEGEILRTLSSGVYMDGQALDHLNEMGYSELTGFAVDRWVNEDCIEVLEDDLINGGFGSRRRNARQSFWWGRPAAMLKPLTDADRILARAVDYAGEQIAPCCMGAFENRCGGRIGVAGYYPWMFLQNLSKSSQIKSLFRWLSRDTLPGYIASFHKINLWIRQPESGVPVAALINACMDTAADVTLMLFTEQTELNVFDMNCAEVSVRSEGSDGAYQRFSLPPIGPWEMRLIKPSGTPPKGVRMS